ncbi:uncharacterized protein LOC135156579 [Lytechinus pictus]|uniref:uncharacterized protein LOC135156579 n=1 Tax=Lytechinus pictus TaxID=7653 RepID=UPI0030BA0EA4
MVLKEVKMGNVEFTQMILFLSLVCNGAFAEEIIGDGYNLNYTLPMFETCSEREHPEKGVVKTIPKLIPTLKFDSGCSGRRNKSGLRICQFPDCLMNPCINGWCEESVISYICHCSPRYTGGRCESMLPNSTVSSLSETEATSPVVYNCPRNINQSVKVGYDGVEVFWIPPNISNPSGTPTIVPNISPGSFFNVTDEPVEVIYTIADGTGWVDESCSFHVSVFYKPSRKIFVTDYGRMFMADLDDLVFNEIPSSGDPYFVTYDDVDKRLYWSDWTSRRVYRSDWNGGNMEAVTARNAESEPNGVAIARNARTLYVAYRKGDRITNMSVRDGSPFPPTETDMIDSLFMPRALTVDEFQGYLYWTSLSFVYRTFLNGTRLRQIVEYLEGGIFEEIITSLNIDLTRNPRRAFFPVSNTGKNFYMDVRPLGYYNNRTLLISNIQTRDISVNNDDVYFLKEFKPIGIAVMKNYDSINREYYLIEIDQFEEPYQLHIAYIEP